MIETLAQCHEAGTWTMAIHFSTSIKDAGRSARSRKFRALMAAMEDLPMHERMPDLWAPLLAGATVVLTHRTANQMRRFITQCAGLHGIEVSLWRME